MKPLAEVRKIGSFWCVGRDRGGSFSILRTPVQQAIIPLVYPIEDQEKARAAADYINAQEEGLPS
jgi:hypothetical protein